MIRLAPSLEEFALLTRQNKHKIRQDDSTGNGGLMDGINEEKKEGIVLKMWVLKI